jgi:hypothetical protein
MDKFGNPLGRNLERLIRLVATFLLFWPKSEICKFIARNGAGRKEEYENNAS